MTKHGANKGSADGRSNMKRPSASDKKVAQGSRIETVLSSRSSKTGTPRLVRSGTSTHGSNSDKSAPLGKDPNSTENRGGIGKGIGLSASRDTKAGPDESGTGRSGSRLRTKRRPAAKKGISRRFLIASLTVILLLVIGTGLLAWNQWFRYDDAADIQGTWVIEGTEQSITITDVDMIMTDEVSYPYTIDTFHKTISFSFKQYSGSGSYAFSPERTTLIITEVDADTGENVSTKLVKQ